MNEVANIDLVSLIEQHSGVSLTPKSNHIRDGKEYTGPCPFCGIGDDRFQAWPEAEFPHWWCRVCGKRGGIAWFLVEYEGMTYPEALQDLGLEDMVYTPSGREDSSNEPPSKKWQERARTFVHLAQKCLWAPRGTYALDYLRKRGFTDKMIRQHLLGYLPTDDNGRWFEDDPAEWGLSPEDCKDGVLKLPEGILIPYYVSGELWKLEVRRYPGPKKKDAPKILSITGSRECLFNVDALQPDKPVVLTESAFNAISGVQTCEGTAVCIATGGAKSAQHLVWVARLKQALCTLVAFDNDEPDEKGERAGDIGAEYWIDRLPNVARARPWSHDINDMLKEGKDIHTWLSNEIESYKLSRQETPQPEAAPLPEQPQEVYEEQEPTAPEAAVCCKCGQPAEHSSPSGHRYCTEHYRCRRGHVPNWRKHEELGIWLCSCYWEVAA